MFDAFQEKEHKSFKEKQKQDMKLLKQELDMMAKNSKKEEIRKRKEQKEIQLAEEVSYWAFNHVCGRC